MFTNSQKKQDQEYLYVSFVAIHVITKFNNTNSLDVLFKGCYSYADQCSRTEATDPLFNKGNPPRPLASKRVDAS